MTARSFRSLRPFAHAALLVLAVALWGCEQSPLDAGERATLQVVLDRSLAAAKGLPAGGARALAREGVRPAVPGVPEILVAVNAARVDELERLLGGLYFDGLGGLPRDQAEAFKWFLRAAEKGHETAQHDVGWMLVQGKGVPADRAQGVEWLRKSARQGHQYAKAKLEQLGEPVEPQPSFRELVVRFVRAL